MRFLPICFVVFFAALGAGCDNGDHFDSRKVPSKLKVLIERQFEAGPDSQLVVYAMDFRKEGYTLTFACPCHIADHLQSEFLDVRVEGDSFKLSLLPGAEYKVEIQYWAPNIDNNKKVQFRTYP